MWRPLDEGEMPLPTPDYLLDGDESAGETHRNSHPNASQNLQGTSGFLRKLETKTPNHTHLVVSRSAARNTVSHQRPPLPGGNQQSSPRVPMTSGSLRGGCRPTQRITTPAIGTFRAPRPRAAQPFQGSQIFELPPRQPQLGHLST
jgi:hypothetical protein